MRQRIVVGISGASGIVYGIRALEPLRELEVETHLVVSRAGGMTRAAETSMSADQLRGLANFTHGPGELGAAITESGGVIMPPVPALYAQPASVAKLVEYTVARALDLFGLDVALRRWEGLPPGGTPPLLTRKPAPPALAGAVEGAL